MIARRCSTFFSLLNVLYDSTGRMIMIIYILGTKQVFLRFRCSLD